MVKRNKTRLDRRQRQMCIRYQLGCYDITGGTLMTSIAYRKMARQRLGWLITGVTLLLVSILIDLSTGPALLNIYDVFSTFFSPEKMSDPMVYVIVHNIRLPMTMMAIVVGASL